MPCMLTVGIEAWSVTSWVLVSDYTGLKLCCFKKPSDKKKNTNERGSVRRDTVPYLDREHLLPR